MDYTITTNIDDILPEQLSGFFVGWSNPPSTQSHLQILNNSEYVVLAIDNATNAIIGFVNAITDKTLSAYIPLLEVLPKYHNNGIGTKLIKKMLNQLKSYYMIDVICDKSVQPFYEKLGLTPYIAMIKRNYQNQKGHKL